jgi:SAM-dependent methyltransferase
MIAIARDRLPTATFHIGELQALPFPDVSFDVVFSANALQYATSPLEALREQVRVLDHAGRLVIVLWGRHDDCDMERAVFPAVRRLLPPPAPGTPQPLGLSDPPVLDALVRDVGLNTLTSEFVNTPYEFADLDLAWRALRPAGPIERAIRLVGADVVKAAVNEAMRPFVAIGGIVRLHNTFRVVVASRA